MERYTNVRLVVFDLDGTLTPSKSPMDREMSELLSRLLTVKKVAVIGGGRFAQFQKQFVSRLRCPAALLPNLFLFPTTSTAFYRWRGERLIKIYEKKLSAGERRRIKAAFKAALKKAGYLKPKKVYGQIIEDRGTQITFSALGQKAPLEAKESWNKNSDIRPSIMRELKKHLKKYEVHRGGLTSVDVTRKGIDKAYGIRQIEKTLDIPRKDMLFIGDAIFPGGNDYAVVCAGVRYRKVNGPEETKKIITSVLTAPRSPRHLATRSPSDETKKGAPLTGAPHPLNINMPDFQRHPPTTAPR